MKKIEIITRWSTIILFAIIGAFIVLAAMSVFPIGVSVGVLISSITLASVSLVWNWYSINSKGEAKINSKGEANDSAIRNLRNDTRK